MTPAEIAKAAAAVGVGAVFAAVSKALDGGTLDDALAAAAEHISDARAQARFPQYRPEGKG